MSDNKVPVFMFSGPVTPMLAARYANHLSECAKNNSYRTYVYIDSPGGAIPSVISMINFTELSGVTVIPWVIGTAMSAAALYVMRYGDNAVITKNSSMMFHMPRGTYDIGKKADVNNKGYSNDIHDMQLKMFSAITGCTLDEARERLRLEYFITAEEALELGIVSRIV